MSVQIIVDLIPRGKTNVRPGLAMQPEYITIHETDNTKAGAGAKNHAQYLKNGAGGASKSWHFTVDDKEIYQHLPLNEVGWHAGDGSRGTGNRKSVGIEICVNSDGNYEKAKKNAAWLVAKLLKQLGLSIGRVVQHNKWSGKNCPRRLRTEGKWNEFLKMVEAEMKGSTSQPAKSAQKPENQNKKEENELLKNAIVINSFADFPAAEQLAAKYKAPIFLRSFAEGEIAETVYVVGGDPAGINAKKVVNLSGKNRYDTAYKVGKHLGSL